MKRKICIIFAVLFALCAFAQSSGRQPRRYTSEYKIYARNAKVVDIDTTNVKRIKIVAECDMNGTQLKFDLLPDEDACIDFARNSHDGFYSHFPNYNYLGMNYTREMTLSANDRATYKKIYLGMSNRNFLLDAAVKVTVTCYYD